MSHITIYITSIFTTFTPNRTGVGSKPVDDDVWTLDHLSIKCQNHCDCQQKGYFGHDSCGPSNKKWGISSLVLFLSPRVSLSLHNVYIDICVIYIYILGPLEYETIYETIPQSNFGVCAKPQHESISQHHVWHVTNYWCFFSFNPPLW